ncbi:hypothetical protein TD95_002218 [Thielaviopsis punctulata]|uniref:RRM domain-containing protein n=1 Tax=Thielaviopsis punctulata TaxID=72032 RepID=A0A0F4ZI30_9PEZI|nr:hypothetical protein TD95_002218 [Thielaviopsis punctulata]
MSALLDKSLDEIASAGKKNNNNSRRRGSRRSGASRPTTTPAGGIQKNSKPARQAPAKANAKATQVKATVNSDSKVIVSNLPKDVTEQQIKEYFVQAVGPIKRVEISYGPNSQSRGIANVTFTKADGATKAFKTLNGLLVDGRPIKIEIVVSAAAAANVIAPIKSLAERATLPKNAKAQPKSAAADKSKARGTAPKSAAGSDAKGRGTRRGRGRSNNIRPKKTEAELDLEMADYYKQAPATAPAAAPAAAAPAVNDTAMDDNIM